MGVTTNKNKKIIRKKSRNSGVFRERLNFLKIIFEIPLDFSELYAHTKRAFKLRQQNKKTLNP